MKQSIIAMLITAIVAICGGNLGNGNSLGNDNTVITETVSPIMTEAGTENSNNEETQGMTTVEIVKPTTNVVSDLESVTTICGTTTKAQSTTVPQLTTQIQSTTVPHTTTKLPETTVPHTTIKIPETTTKLTNSNLSFARQVVELVNKERTKAGLNAVAIDTKIEAAALIRAKEIEKSFSHTRPNGSGFSTVLTENGISFHGSGENIAWGQRSPEEVMQGWMNSPGHRANILNSKYTKIGTAYYIGENGRGYWVQLFIY